ncbi:MAG: hypothetical protein ACI80I_002706 [Akkermansiaceae bacterium]|jgi:hypothetical protein
MALIINQTGELLATGFWQKIAGAGECAIECSEPFRDAIMEDVVTLPTAGHRHAAAHVDGNNNLSSWTVPTGGSVWVYGQGRSGFHHHS